MNAGRIPDLPKCSVWLSTGDDAAHRTTPAYGHVERDDSDENKHHDLEKVSAKISTVTAREHIDDARNAVKQHQPPEQSRADAKHADNHAKNRIATPARWRAII